MAAPNIAGLTTITGKTMGIAVGSTQTTLLTNATGSGKVFKVNTVIISNIDGTSAADMTLEFYDLTTRTDYKITSTVSVPPDNTLLAIDKNTSIYLEEGDILKGTAGTAGDLMAVISYEEIS